MFLSWKKLEKLRNIMVFNVFQSYIYISHISLYLFITKICRDIKRDRERYREKRPQEEPRLPKDHFGSILNKI